MVMLWIILLRLQDGADNAIYDSKAKGYRFSDNPSRKNSRKKRVWRYEWKTEMEVFNVTARFIDDKDNSFWASQFLLQQEV